MKKILLVTRPIAPPWDEASKNFAYFLAKTARDFQFHVLTPGQVDSLEHYIKQEHIYSSAHLDWTQRLRLFGLALKLKNFDIVHFMLTPTKLNSWAFKKFLTNKTTKTIQTIATLREDLFSDEELRKIIFADLIVTYSDYAKNKLASLGFKNIERIYPGIDLEKYSPTPKNLATIELFGIKNTDFVITYPGEYTRLGATDDLVNMLPDLFKKIPAAKFIFANRVKNENDALKKAEVIKKLEKKGVLDKIIFTDTFADMSKIYNLSDIVVFPVRDMKGKFDVPLAVIEAFACEKPVVISDLSILKEFATKHNSVIIEAGKPEQLVASLVHLHSNPSEAATIAKNARKYASENFDINSVAAKYAEAYNKLSL